MHEMGIAKNILDIVEYELSMRSNSDFVEKVVFRISRSNAILPESLTFFFDAMKTDYAKLKVSKLEFIIDPFIGLCISCGKDIQAEDLISICNFCGGIVKIESNRDMLVESIILKDEENQVGN